MWNLVDKPASDILSLSSQVKLPSYSLIYLILNSSLSTLASYYANLVLSIVGTMGGDTMVAGDTMVIGGGVPCETPDGRTYPAYDTRRVVSSLLIPVG